MVFLQCECEYEKLEVWHPRLCAVEKTIKVIVPFRFCLPSGLLRDAFDKLKADAVSMAPMDPGQKSTLDLGSVDLVDVCFERAVRKRVLLRFRWQFDGFCFVPSEWFHAS